MSTTQPAPYRVLCERRDYIVLEFKLPSEQPSTAHLLCLFDQDRDPRLLSVLTALFYRSPMMLALIPAVHENNGIVDFWCVNAAQAANAIRALKSAADAALRPLHDTWRVNEQPRIVKTRNGLVDRDSLPPSDLLKTSARHLPIGVVGARS
jgi:hypothetical protein